ncbi:MAG: ribbon-helix-helix protein, CopG family [Candidatus Heimdallarchaeota archaeon]|nr:ribbon-helix-helix protein, CopG family [Candidatus Heimdallarchaeota archaeon]
MSMSPITFRIPYGMLDIMEEIVKKGEYANRAELIREAISDLINYENKLQEQRDLEGK